LLSLCSSTKNVLLPGQNRYNGRDVYAKIKSVVTGMTLMGILGSPYLKVIVSSVCVYIFIVLAIRLFGKKELAQLSVVDLVFILLISNAVQNAMVGSDTSLLGGLIAAGSLFVVNALFKNLIYRFPSFGKWLQGEPMMLIYHGHINQSNLLRTQITFDELLQAVREHGVGSLTQVDLAVLEPDGNISVLSQDFRKKTVKRRKAHRVVGRQVG
jgi:uncharacterized membrane protein YcaP (DUF421 family)